MGDGREKDLPVVKPVETPVVVDAVRESAPEMLEGSETGESPKEAVMMKEPRTRETAASAPAPVVSMPVRIVPKAGDRLTKEIEDILSEDLTDLYLAMPPEKQQQFKTKGEETTSKVRELVRAAKVNAKKIFQLIRDWLKVIPAVNRFFLEQEAKIKTDKILLVSEEEKKRNETM
ncbi:hypothetical protein HZA87_04635 [Candidatus Uhrbacteria bacterium]|nr:hypothetical protein [Candidatus Uhrbacteria bacterium]